MSGIQLSQPGGAGVLNSAGAQHPAPVTVEVGPLCQLSMVGVSSPTWRWILTRPTGSSAVLSSTTSAGPSLVIDLDAQAYSIKAIDINEVEYILDIVSPTTGGGGGGGGGSVVTTLNTYTDVRAASYGAGTPPAAFIVQCRETTDDGGGGLFAYDSTDTTSADDDGTILIDGEGHRFKRITDTIIDARWFGAINDLVELTAQFSADVINMTSGSAAVTGYSFAARYVGAKILVRGAGVAGADLKTTIASATTLTAAASTSVTTADAFFGHDSTDAFNAAIAFRLQGGTVDADPSGGYLIDGTLDLSNASGTILDGTRGRAYRIGATIANVAASGSAIKTPGAHGVQLRGLRVMNVNAANTDPVIDISATTPGITADTANVALKGVVVDGNPTRSSISGVRMGGNINCTIGTAAEPCEFIRCERGIWPDVGYANETHVWCGVQDCGKTDNTAFAIQDPRDGWIINAILQPGVGKPHRGIGYTKDIDGNPASSSAGGTWRVWAGDALTDDGVAIEVFGAGIRVGGHFEDEGDGSVAIRCFGGSSAIHLNGGSVFRIENGVEFFTDNPFNSVTNGFTADAVDFQGCDVPYTGVFTGGATGFRDDNAGLLGPGYQHTFVGGLYTFGLGIAATGWISRGDGQLDDSAGTFIGYKSAKPTITADARANIALLYEGAGTGQEGDAVIYASSKQEGRGLLVRGVDDTSVEAWTDRFHATTVELDTNALHTVWRFPDLICVTYYSATPEGHIPCAVGSFCLTENGKVFLKTTGSGNTGWTCIFDGNGAISRVARATPWFSNAAEWAINDDGHVIAQVNTDSFAYWVLDVPHGSVISTVTAFLSGTGHGALPANMPIVTVHSHTISTNGTATAGSTTDSSASTGAYDAAHVIDVSVAITVDNVDHRYTVILRNEHGANAQVGLDVYMIMVSFTPATPDRGAA